MRKASSKRSRPPQIRQATPLGLSVRHLGQRVACGLTYSPHWIQGFSLRVVADLFKAREGPTKVSEFKGITKSERGVTGAWGRRKPAVLVQFQPF